MASNETETCSDCGAELREDGMCPNVATIVEAIVDLGGRPT